MMTHYVYIITQSDTGEYYIGVRSCTGDANKDPYMGSPKAWKKMPSYNISLQTKTVLGTFETRDDANFMEKDLIDRNVNDPLNRNYHNSETFCNFGNSHSDETRARMSKSQKGSKKHSPETRAKISAARKGKKVSEETREKMRAAQKGKKHSVESRAKMRASKKNMSAETRAKMSESQKGKKHSAESREKMSAVRKGKKHSAETKARMSASIQSKTVYNFVHKSGLEISCTQYYLRHTYNLHPSSLFAVIKGTRKSTRGWMIKKLNTGLFI